MAMINENEIRKAIAVLKPDGELFEIRVEGNKRTTSGYFRDADTLIRELKKQDLDGRNVYITLNYLNDDCYAREQKDKLKAVKTTTSDNDVVGYNYLFVDIDPERPKDTSSTDEQMDYAKEVANKVYDFMGKQGFEKPIVAMSGNGVHLLYKIELEANNERKQIVKTCLETLDMFFSEKGKVKIDTVNFNPARICKLYGTLAQKGADDEKHPHRMSKIVSVPEELKATDIEYLKKLCSLYPKETEKPKKYNHYAPSDFDLEDWMNKYGLRYRKTGYSGGTKYILDCCPFDSNHKGKDAAIFKSNNGALGFHCFHNSCADKKWQDVRLLFEPEAYEKQWQEDDRKMYKSFNRDRKPEPKKIVKKDNIPVFYTAEDVFNLPPIQESFIKTGIETLDKRTRGLQKSRVSLVSGLRGSAKSTWLSQVILDAVDADNNVGCFSGELTERNFMRWMNQQAAGKSFVEPSQYPGYYNVPRKYMEQIAKWLGNRFWLYNNNYGNDFNAVMEQFEKQVEEQKLDLLVLDNLMAFDISSLSEQKFEAQTRFVLQLADLAKRKNIHIIFVAHPRKAMGFLRLDDISGSADLANAVDYAFIIHRNNNDFQRLSKAMFNWNDDNEVYSGTNVIEVAKDRDGGTQDLFIPLWYEVESKRLKNNLTENKLYGWCKGDTLADNGFADINMETPWD